MMSRVDLHMHTTSSDGSLAPAELVAAARQHGLDVIAVTDHDTLDGVAPAIEAAGTTVRVLPGVELGALDEGYGLHLLAYGFDAADAGLRTRLDSLAATREERMRAMLERLDAQGIHIAWQEVARHARRAVGRPHLAAALVDAGYARDRADAFNRLIGNASPSYVPSSRLRVEEAAAMVAEAGGAVALAHPLLYRHPLGLEALLPRLRAARVGGLEVYHTDHDAAGTAYLARLAAEHGFWYSGGSDFHGPGCGEARLGGVAVPPDVLGQGPFAALFP